MIVKCDPNQCIKGQEILVSGYTIRAMKKLTIGVLSLTILIVVLFTYLDQHEKPSLVQEKSISFGNLNKQSLDEFIKQNNAKEDIAKAYKIAYENPQNVLSKVKCYCGCIKNNSHKNNRDCFINEDGSFDLMGLNCGLCVKTALISKQMLDEGKSVQEISDFVDAKFGKVI